MSIKNWFKSQNISRIDRRSVKYVPKEDITAYEVSKCLEILIEIFNYHNIMRYDGAKSFVLSYPPEVTRHFKLE